MMVNLNAPCVKQGKRILTVIPAKAGVQTPVCPVPAAIQVFRRALAFRR